MSRGGDASRQLIYALCVHLADLGSGSQITDQEVIRVAVADRAGHAELVARGLPQELDRAGAVPSDAHDVRFGGRIPAYLPHGVDRVRERDRQRVRVRPPSFEV